MGILAEVEVLEIMGMQIIQGVVLDKEDLMEEQDLEVMLEQMEMMDF